MTRIYQIKHIDEEKIGYRKVGKKKKQEKKGQLNLFSAQVQVHNLYRGSIFEYALKLDEEHDPKAAEIYLKAIEEGDCISDCYCNLGIIASEEGEQMKAFKYFILSLKDDPGHPEAHFNLANLYFEAEDYRLAKLHFEIANNLNPEFTGIYYNLGLTCAMLEEFDEAVKYLHQFKNYCPDESEKAEEIINTIFRTQKI